MEDMDFEEYGKIEESFEGDITLFWIMIQLGYPKMTESVPRACVSFFPNGEIDMRINPDFWKKLKFYEKRFVFAHELTHVLFSHGTRMSKMGDRKKANIAADIVTNESLVEKFGFEREKIRFHNNLCWRDTVFGEKESKVELKNFEHYYNRLLNGEGNIDKNTLDNHEGDSGVPSNHFNSQKVSDSFVDKILDKVSGLSESELEELQKEIKDFLDNEDGNEASHGYSNTIGKSLLSYEFKPSYYKMFKNVIDRWLDSFELKKETDQFTFREPFLELVSEKMLMPHSHEEDFEFFNKNRLWVFVDASGSCNNYINDFIKACSGIPEKYFDFELFSFTTEVAKIEKTNNKYVIKQALGGTSFACIEKFLEYNKNNGYKLPHYIFLLTDGMASPFKVNVLPVERWHFFITPYDYGGKSSLFDLAVPKGAKIHNFRDINI